MKLEETEIASINATNVSESQNTTDYIYLV